MNDIILMSIKGGRYLEAEGQINQVILTNPSSEVYFLMGSVKSNLILSKGRDLSEVIFCFEKSIDLSDNKNQTKVDSGAFLFGILRQLISLEQSLVKESRNQLLKSVAGLALTYFSSKIIDDAKGSFGVISGVVGASFGVGIIIDGLEEFGDIQTQIEYVGELKIKIEKYLKDNFPEIKDKFYGNVNLEKLSSTIQKFPNEFFDFETISDEKSALTKFKEIFEDLKISKTDNFLFGLKWHHQVYASLFYKEYIIAITRDGLLGDFKYVKLDYNDLTEVSIFETFKNYEPQLSTLTFEKAIEVDLNGNQNKIKNFRLGGKDKLNRNNSLLLKKVKTGFFKKHDYTESRNYFNGCFETSEISK